jgi:hypothetical protein
VHQVCVLLRYACRAHEPPRARSHSTAR